MADDSSEYQWHAGVSIPDTDGQDWVLVSGGRLKQPIYIKLIREGGKHVVSAVHIENQQRIGSADLRFPLNEIVQQFGDDWSADGPELERLSFGEHQEAWYGWALMREFIEESVPEITEPRPRGRGATPPTKTELKSFALTYLREYAERPRGAVTRAAKSHGMHRVTAHKWIDQCRAAGILPEKDS